MIDFNNIYELEFECTTLCNAQCPLCFRNYKSFKDSKYSKTYIRPYDDVIKQLETMKNLNFVMLVGSMSEPTLYKNFLQLVSYLKSRNIKIEICTNGDTNDRAFWEELGKLLDYKDMVYFTICGSTQEMHEKYRVGTNLSRIVKNASYLRAVKPIDYAQCIRFKYNSKHFDSEEFKKFVSLNFSNVYMTETFYPKNIDDYNEKFDVEMFMPSSEKISKYNKLKKLAEIKFLNGAGAKSDCMCKRTNRYQMDVFGNIYPCYLMLEYFAGKCWNYAETDLINVNHECCKFCDSVVQSYAKRYNLEYII